MIRGVLLWLVLALPAEAAVRLQVAPLPAGAPCAVDRLLVQRLEHSPGVELVERGAELTAKLTSTPGGWRLSLEKAGGEVALSRELSGGACDAAAFAASLIIERYLRDMEVAGRPPVAISPGDAGRPVAATPILDGGTPVGPPSFVKKRPAVTTRPAPIEAPPDAGVTVIETPPVPEPPIRPPPPTDVGPIDAGRSFAISRTDPPPLPRDDGPIDAGRSFAVTRTDPPPLPVEPPEPPHVDRSPPPLPLPTGLGPVPPIEVDAGLAANEAPDAGPVLLASADPLTPPPPTPEVRTEVPATPTWHLARWEVSAGAVAWAPAATIARTGAMIDAAVVLDPGWRVSLELAIGTVDTTNIFVDSAIRGTLSTQPFLAGLTGARCVGGTVRFCGGAFLGTRIGRGWTQGDFVFQQKTLWLARPTVGLDADLAWLPLRSLVVRLELLGLVEPFTAQFEVDGVPAASSSFPIIEGLLRLSVGFGVDR